LPGGDWREDGEFSGSTLCRGEISERGGALDLGETEGIGDAVTLGEGEGFGDAATLGAAEDFGEVEGAIVGVVVLRFAFQENVELSANAFSRLAAVTTSPPLNVPSVLLAGIVAVGGWPTGIGS
jgi:hypothetical protein